MMEAICSVGLPSLSARSQVPTSFFNFSRVAFVGGAGSFGAGLSPPRLATARLKVRMVNTPPKRIRRILVTPSCQNAMDMSSSPSHDTSWSNGNGHNRHEKRKRSFQCRIPTCPNVYQSTWRSRCYEENLLETVSKGVRPLALKGSDPF